jgi:hypothetical protein
MVELVWEELHSLKRRTGERRMLIRTVVDQLPVRIRWELDVFQKLALPSEDLFERLTDSLAASIAQAFSVEEDEVAILLLRGRMRMLRFAYPLVHYVERTNMFPVTTTSIAGEVLQSGRGRIDNDVPHIEHLDVYEQIRVKENRPLEIQKMVSAPLLIPRGNAGKQKGEISQGSGTQLLAIGPFEVERSEPLAGPAHLQGNPC